MRQIFPLAWFLLATTTLALEPAAAARAADGFEVCVRMALSLA